MRDVLTLAAMILLAACAGSPGTTRHVEQRHARVQQSDSVGPRAASVALEQVGVPYRFGGSTPRGFDCSGLVHYAYLQAGKRVPRTTGQLWASADEVERDRLQEGDILFFRIDGKMSHVGMYIGEGRFVHAPSSGKRVAVELLHSDFYSGALLRAGRLR